MSGRSERASERARADRGYVCACVRVDRKARGALDLTALAKRGLLREGDVLEYRRTFPAPLGVTVEKDLLVRTSALRSLRAPLTLKLCAAGHR